MCNFNKGISRSKETKNAFELVESFIYNVPYDKLDDYLKGVRDMVNLVNASEDSESIAKYILEQINQI